jgi:hypothetical protein
MIRVEKLIENNEAQELYNLQADELKMRVGTT